VCCYEWMGKDKKVTLEVEIPDCISLNEQEFNAIFEECKAQATDKLHKEVSYYKDVVKEYTTSNVIQLPTKKPIKTVYDYYSEWTETDFQNCIWDLKTRLFIKSDGKTKMSKNSIRKLRKLREKLAVLKKKKKYDTSNVLPQPEDDYICANCGKDLDTPKERENGYCYCCMFTDYKDETVREMPMLCTICKAEIDEDDDDQVDNGVCGACLEHYTKETGYKGYNNG
jgi:hypothetical protein